MAKHILAIDDDPDIREILRTMLTSAGYKVTLAADGAEGLAAAKSGRPDLILADIMMPTMDGWELCFRVRDDAALRGTPFIFLTARGTLADHSRGGELGADDYVEKPFKAKELLRRIEETLGVLDLIKKVGKPSTKAKSPASKKAPTRAASKKAAKKTTSKRK